MSARRIVSLLPSATEALFALGLGERVVGVSHECDFPPAARLRPALTAPRIDPAADSAAIQAAVAGLAGSAQGLYALNAALLAELAPDLIVTQDLCEVCAVSPAAVRAAARMMEPAPAVLTLNPRRLAEVIDDVARVAGAAGEPATGAALVGSLTARIDAVRMQARRAPGAGRPPRVACLEWLEPVMLAGNWVPEMVQAAGGTCGPGAGEHGGWTAWERVAAFAPEAVFVVPCGFSRNQTRRELPALRARPGWSDLPAVRAGRVFALDGNAYFNRPGPRIVDSLELMAGALWPAEFADFARSAQLERV